MVNVKVVKTDALRHLQTAIETLSHKVGKVGWFENARYDGNQSSVGPVKPIQVAQVAAMNEFGAPGRNIPARPFMRPTIANKSNQWLQIARIKSKLVVDGKMTADGLMDLIGQVAKSDIQKTIEALWSPALSPATIKARISKYSSDPELKESTRKKRKKELQKFVRAGFYKPLEDTGHMLSTITNIVETE